jgi:hypothetical protein
LLYLRHPIIATCSADESRMADCLPECTTLQRTNIVQVSIMFYIVTVILKNGVVSIFEPNVY